MHVHAADDEAAADAGEIASNGLVALALGRLLRAPARERVGGGRDRGEAVLARQLGDGVAQAGKLDAGLARRLMHPGADLDLRFQELARHLVGHGLLRRVEQGLRHLAHEVPARLVDEQVLLLYADGEAGVLECHESHGRIETSAVQIAGAAGSDPEGLTPLLPSNQSAAGRHNFSRKSGRKKPKWPTLATPTSAGMTRQMDRSRLAAKCSVMWATAA